MPRFEKEIIVMNKKGLHARPAALFVQLADKFQSKITITKDKEEINGKSIMGILMLGAQFSSKLKLIVDGVDAEQAIGQLAEFLNAQHDEEK